jgi:hypothetical protein
MALAAINSRYTGWAKPMLQATAAMRVAGAGFHAYGVSRNIGGFYNWSQNLLNGPPLPARRPLAALRWPDSGPSN